MKHHVHPIISNNAHKRWTYRDVMEFCMLFPEIDDAYEWADYFGRSHIAVRALMVRHAKLVRIGGDPTTVRFVQVMHTIKSNAVLWDKDFGNPFLGKSVFDDCAPIKPRF